MLFLRCVSYSETKRGRGVIGRIWNEMRCGMAEWLILLCMIDTMVFMGQKNDNCSIMHVWFLLWQM